MKFDENLAVVHAYLCADGYVRKHLPGRPREYKFGLRNTNNKLLRDFQERCIKYFGIKPHLRLGQRCEKSSKEIHTRLVEEFGSFHSREWTFPIMDNCLVKIWLRTFFDCEGWVFCKSHQNRHIGIDSINEKGLNKIKENLERLGIKSVKKIIKGGGIFRLILYGKDNLKRFRDNIGFLHPDKKEKLENVLLDYVDYSWNIKPNSGMIRKIMLEKAKIKSPYIVRIFSREKENLENLEKNLFSLFGIKSIKINMRFNGLGTRYFELNVNKKEEVNKLIKQNLINPEQLKRINWERIKHE